MNLGWTAVSDNDDVATALDSEGHVVWLDLKAIRGLL
jgi:hypothetical protein